MATIDYKEKYMQALERAKYYHDRDNIQFLENIFHELAESEDEKIRKEMISWLKGFIGEEEGCGYTEDEIRERIAWLEKQGETFTKKDVDDAYLKGICDAKHELEKQGEKGANGNEREIPNSEQRSVDKVEPRFKIDDWIVYNDNLYHIINISLQKYYECLRVDGTVHIFSLYIDSKSRLWTIQDAKDGDVLLSPSTPEGDKECPFIFKEIDKNGIVRFHAALLQNEELKIADGITNVIGYANAKYHIPATKEQRDLLFHKMKEAGYKWDADKKELKKIEQEPDETEKGANGNEREIPNSAWSEDDEKMIQDIINDIAIAQEQVYCKSRCEDEINWLKFLKDRYTWKPSDEQLEAVDVASRNIDIYDYKEALESLYNNLKAL